MERKFYTHKAEVLYGLPPNHADALLEIFMRQQNALLQSASAEGWELISVVSQNDKFYYYFKKEVEF